MKTKRIISWLLIPAMLLSIFSFAAFAKTTTEQDEPVYVATVYVCQRSRNYNMSGHTWLYFKNLTNHAIQVGLYSVPKGQGVSIGTFGYSIVDGKGLYYNAEGWRYNKAKLKDFVCVKKNVTNDELAAMGTQITKCGYWSYLVNCSWSAFTIWNVTSEKTIPYLVLPFFAKLSILMYPDHEDGFFMYSPKANQVFKQVGFGEDAYLIAADASVPSDYNGGNP